MKTAKASALGLRAGDLVEVRSELEILATLDERGAIDGMPFMPEMLAYCGQRFRVYKRAEKTCNTITIMESRRLRNTVHLEGLRCSGEAHGGCQAQCLLFWNEAWLRRVSTRKVSPAHESSSPADSVLRCDGDRLSELTRHPDGAADSEIRYRCQVTDLLEASESLPWWDLRQYVREVFCGNESVLDLIKAALFHVFKKTIRITAHNLQISLYNRFQSWRGGTPYPFRWGTLGKTPAATLGLQAGDLVQIKSHDEILATLNAKNKNLGLRFDAEMVPYCGSVHRVRARVERIIEERTGRMTHFSRDCLILEDVICRARYSECRLFCPRSIYPYWREIWLERVGPAANSHAISVRVPSDQEPSQTQAQPRGRRPSGRN
jgi:hypothetical protein